LVFHTRKKKIKLTVMNPAKILIGICLLMIGQIAFGQHIYKIKTDSLLVTNDSCNAELNLENSTRNVNGFLYNKGNGRTEFRKALVQLPDGRYLIGGDTLNVKSGLDSGYIWNQYAQKQTARAWIDSIRASLYHAQITNGRLTTLFKATAGDTTLFQIRTAKNPGQLASIYIGDSAGLIAGVDPTRTAATNANVAIGAFALDSVTSENNVAVGAEALRFAQMAWANTAVGHQALYKYKTGGWNAALGQFAGLNLLSGHDNTFLGQSAGSGIRSGSGNIVIGGNTFEDSSATNYNTVVGQFAAGHATGSYNTFIGGQSGVYNGGNYNVFLGYRAGYNEIGSNKLYISNSLTTTPLIYGEFDNQRAVINGSLSINDTSRSNQNTNKLYVNGSSKFAGNIFALSLPVGTSTDSLLVADVNGQIKKYTPASLLGGGGSFSAYNGLTKSSDSVMLGGDLFKSTTVNMNDNSLSFVNGSKGNNNFRLSFFRDTITSYNNLYVQNHLTGNTISGTVGTGSIYAETWWNQLQPVNSGWFPNYVSRHKSQVSGPNMNGTFLIGFASYFENLSGQTFGKFADFYATPVYGNSATISNRYGLLLESLKGPNTQNSYAIYTTGVDDSIYNAGPVRWTRYLNNASEDSVLTTDIYGRIKLKVLSNGSSGTLQQVTTAGNTSSNDIYLKTITPATSSQQQISPQLVLEGNYWNTTSNSSDSVRFRNFIDPISGNGQSSQLRLQSSVGSSGWADRMTIPASGQITVNAALGVQGILSAQNGTLYVGQVDHINRWMARSNQTHSSLISTTLPSINLASGQSFDGHEWLSNSVTESSSGTHNSIVGNAFFPLSIVDGTATTNYGATVYIGGAARFLSGSPIPANTNYALWVDSGLVRIDGIVLQNDGADTLATKSYVRSLAGIGGSTSSYSTIQETGSALTQRTNLNFGYGVTATDNSTLSRTDVDVDLSNSESFLASDITLTANTFSDAVSLSLGAGTWMISGSLTIESPNNTAQRVTYKLWNGTTVYQAGEASSPAMGASTKGYVTVPVSCIVVLTGTTTVKVSVASTAASLIKATPADNNTGTTGKATSFRAVRIK
jgi:hypothetical protein